MSVRHGCIGICRVVRSAVGAPLKYIFLQQVSTLNTMSETSLEMHEHEVDAVRVLLSSTPSCARVVFAQALVLPRVLRKLRWISMHRHLTMIKDVSTPSAEKGGQRVHQEEQARKQKRSSLKSTKPKEATSAKNDQARTRRTEKEQVHKEKKRRKEKKSRTGTRQQKKAVKL